MDGVPWRIVISMGAAIERPTPASAISRHTSGSRPVAWMNSTCGPSNPSVASCLTASPPKLPSMWVTMGRSSSRPSRQASRKVPANTSVPMASVSSWSLEANLSAATRRTSVGKSVRGP